MNEKEKILEAFWCKLSKDGKPIITETYACLHKSSLYDKLVIRQIHKTVGWWIFSKEIFDYEIVKVHVRNEERDIYYNAVFREPEKVAEIKTKLKTLYNKYREDGLKDLICTS